MTVEPLNIAELRARKNKMSQKELARNLNVTQRTISNWEKDPLSIDGRYLKQISIFFGVSTDKLLGVELQKNLQNT